MMAFYKSILSRGILSILMLASSLVIEAQNTPNVIVTPKIRNTFVEKEGVYYTIVDKTLDYEITITEEDYIISKASWVFKRDDTNVASSNETTTIISFPTDKDGLYKLTGEITLSWQENNKEMSTVVKIDEITNVRLLPIPTLDIVGNSEIVSYHDREFELNFSTTTKDGFWEISMSPTLSTVKIEGSDLSFKSKQSNTTNAPISFTIDADCRYIYEGKEIYTEKREKAFSVTVYPIAAINYGTTDVLNVAKKGTYNLSVSVSGGYDKGWKFQWEKNKNKISGNENSIEIEVITTEEMVTEEYEVTATNGYEGSKFFNGKKSFQVNIFPETSMNYVSPSEFHIAQDTAITLEIETAGGNKDGWEYRWKENGQELSYIGKAYIKEIKPGNEIVTLKYEVVATNKYDNDVLDQLSKEFTVTVYPKPYVEKPYFTEIVVGGEELERYVNSIGGNPGGWKFTWYRNDVAISNANEYKYIFTENNRGSDFVECKYSVQVENYHENKKWFDETFDFELTVYPNVVIEYKIEPGSLHLYQESVVLGASFSGGCNTEGSSWEYRWYLNTAGTGTVLSNENEYSYDSYNNTNNIKKDIYILEVINKYNEETIYIKNIAYDIYNYPLAKIARTTSDNIVTSGGNKIEFGIKSEYANPDGWEYQWIKNDNILSSEKNSSFSMIEPNNSETETLNHTYSVVATNKFGTKIWVQDTLKFYSVIRPKIIPPTQVEYNEKMREKDNVNLRATAGRGGHPDGWSYQWYINGTLEITGQNGLELSHYPSVGNSTLYYMETQNVQYALYCKNIDVPTGKVLYEETIEYDILLHRRPFKPLELVKKGSNSNIYIADMYQGGYGLDNTKLSDYQYNFCFGYGNTIIEREDPTLRYQQYTKQQTNEGPWVYTYWEYPNGFVCMSDTVYFGNTRVPTSIADIYENTVIKINRYGFTATLKSKMPAIARIISIDGKVIKEVQYEPDSNFNERFDLEGLNKGLYLIEVCIGENREVSKFFINE